MAKANLRSRFFLLLSCALAALAARAARAQAPSLVDPIQDLQQRLAAQEAELRALRAQVDQQSPGASVPGANGNSGVPVVAQNDGGAMRSPGNLLGQPNVGALDSPIAPPRSGAAFRSPGALIGAPSEEFPTFRITGFTQLDSGFYSQSAKNIAQVGDAQDVTGFRRARLAVVGKAAELTSYYLEVDFAAAGRPSFEDVWVEQGYVPLLGDVRVGQYVQPFSVDAESGFRNLPFLERSLPFLAFVPFRRVGVMSSNGTEDEMTYWAVSGFRTGGFQNAPLGDDRDALDLGNIGGYSFSGRITHLLFDDRLADDRYFWQIGTSYDYSQLGANDAAGSTTNVPFYQAKTTPEFGPLGYSDLGSSAVFATPYFVDTGRYRANDFNLFGVETLVQWGAFDVQAEFMATTVDSVVAGPIFYEGAYAEVMYRLTGEHRQYDRRLGALRNPIPFTDFIPLKRDGICGWGAWEIGARWSFVDLRNPTALNGHYYNSTTNLYTSNNNTNGLLNDATVGLTWFLNYHTKLQFNWIHSMLENTGQAAATRGFSSADLFVSRVQVDF